MCNKCKPNNRKIDKCMKILCEELRCCESVRASCCGHGKYPPTIVIEDDYGIFWDTISNIKIPRSTRFYLKDKQGYYYIPEVIKNE